MTGKFIRAIVAVFLLVVFLPNTFAANEKGSRVRRTVFSNATPVSIVNSVNATAPTIATPYPSSINVSGMTGPVTRVAVTLDGLTTTMLRDMDFLLVGPTGAKFIFFSDGASGVFVGVDDRIYTFADDAATTFPFNFDPPSGTYKPTSGDVLADSFPAPAPAGPYNQPTASTFASVFNGTDPNGSWSLYAVDDSLNFPGSINSGWSVTITTSGLSTTFANSSYVGLDDVTAAAQPYGTAVSVSGLSGYVSDLKVTLNGFQHTRASDVDVLLVSPNGRGVVLMSDAGGNTSSSDITFDDAAPGQLPSTITTGIYKPTDFNGEGTADSFPTPAPLRPHLNTGINFLSNFHGFSPNGEWRLYVVDDAIGNSGAISGGWSLDITTSPILPPSAPSCAAPSFSPSSYPTGVSPTNVAVADFNNDSKPDLAVTNQVSNDVSVLLGNGDGTFANQMLFSAGAAPYAIVAGKFNADDNFDLAVANSSSNNVSILLGNGSGSFSAPVNFFAGANPISIASGDFNNDSKADLVVANFGGFFSGSVSVLIGTGTGTFTNGTSVRTRTQPSFVAVSNFNGDAFQDLIIANFGSNSVSTFFGNGTGTFQLQQNITTGAGPVSVEVADLGSDGIADIAVANYNADTITFCTGTASGGFVSCSSNTSAGGNNPISVTSADFVGSGTRNIATALSGSNVVGVLTSIVTVGDNPNAVRSADFNGDGKADIVSVNFSSNDVSILRNSCVAARGNLFDYDGDRRTDYAVFRPTNSSYFIHSLNQTGPVRSFGRPNDAPVPADYTADRRADFAFYRSTTGLWHVLDSFGRPVYFLQFGLPGDLPVAGDYDGDGKADIAVWRPSDGNWYIRRSSDNLVVTATFGTLGDKPSAADFDGDGKDDIAVFRPSTGVWYINRSSDQGFSIVQFGMSGDVTVPGDYDGDAKADIAVWRPSTGAWYVLKSTDGGFVASGWGATGDLPVPGDYEGDGKFDFAVWRPTDNVWYVRKSSDAGAFYFQWGISTDLPMPNSFVR